MAFTNKKHLPKDRNNGPDLPQLPDDAYLDIIPDTPNDDAPVVEQPKNKKFKAPLDAHEYKAPEHDPVAAGITSDEPSEGVTPENDADEAAVENPSTEIDNSPEVSDESPSTQNIRKSSEEIEASEPSEDDGKDEEYDEWERKVIESMKAKKAAEEAAANGSNINSKEVTNNISTEMTDESMNESYGLENDVGGIEDNGVVDDPLADVENEPVVSRRGPSDMDTSSGMFLSSLEERNERRINEKENSIRNNAIQPQMGGGGGGSSLEAVAGAIGAGVSRAIKGAINAGKYLTGNSDGRVLDKMSTNKNICEYANKKMAERKGHLTEYNDGVDALNAKMSASPAGRDFMEAVARIGDFHDVVSRMADSDDVTPEISQLRAQQKELVNSPEFANDVKDLEKHYRAMQDSGSEVARSLEYLAKNSPNDDRKLVKEAVESLHDEIEGEEVKVSPLTDKEGINNKEKLEEEKKNLMEKMKEIAEMIMKFLRQLFSFGRR